MNEAGIICNKRFFNLSALADVDVHILGALLNSTLTWFFKEYYGREVGREGFLDTDVFVTRQIPIVSPRQLSPKIQKRLVEAFTAISQRPQQSIHPMGNELEQPDRIELDDAVLEALGIEEAEERLLWREQIYDRLQREYTDTREMEEIATENRRKAARGKQKASARSIAREIWRDLEDKSIFRRFPDDFVPISASVATHQLPEGGVQVGKELFTGAGALGTGYIMIGEELRFVGSIAKAQFVQTWQETGNVGSISIPDDDDLCLQVMDEYAAYKREIETELYSWAQSKTADERLQNQLIGLLWGYIQDYLQAQTNN